jgi:LmbE family N-acetylglucosaminyl deacetylase
VPEPLKLLVVGAHPDDCELKAGGLALKYRALGHRVKFVSCTDGSTGHQSLAPAEVAKIRAREAEAACALAGIESEVWDIPSNAIEADLPTRERMIRLIRAFSPDVLVTHRTNDYHPDHTRTALLVQDSSYAVRVPAVCPDSPAMRQSPLILLMQDRFSKPAPFRADLKLDIASELPMKARMLDCHQSQVYDWLPWIDGILDQVPLDAAARLDWLMRNREELSQGFESFEASEYGAALTPALRARLFPFA